MTAGDVGTVITVNAGGFNMAGGSAFLLVQAQAVPAPAHSRYSMTIDASGLTARYVTSGLEFPTGGMYNLQLEVDLGADKFTSPIVAQHVNPLILP